MAADGDMFAQRKAWGYNQLCAAACDRAPMEKLVAIEEKSVRNMLSNGYAVPSLKVSVEYGFQIVNGSRAELKLDSPAERLIAGLRGLERTFVEAPNASDVSKAVLAVGLSALEKGRTFESSEEFAKECCHQLGTFWLRRHGWESFPAYVMKNGKLSRDAYHKMAAEACSQAGPQVAKLIQSAMSSPGGRLPKRGPKRNKQIEHTPEGLNEVLS